MTRYYFAYGSNLSDDDRASHDPPCPDNGLRKVGVASLPDRRLGFTRRSIKRGGGVLDVVPHLGAVAPGVVYEVQDDSVWEWLDKKEGAPKHYRRIDVTVLTQDGGVLRACTYEVVNREGFVTPAPAYLEIVRKAYRAHLLDVSALDEAAANRPASLLQAVFAYGTLMRGESRHHVFGAAAVECALLAEGVGELYDCTSYPALCVGGPGAAAVRGELIRLREAAVPALLAELDSIEGFRGYGQPVSLYERRLMSVDVGEGKYRTAWVYVMPSPPGTARRIDGDWRAHRGARRTFLEQLVATHCAADDELAIATKIIRSQPPWVPQDEGEAARALLPLADSLDRGDISERALARATGRWTAVPQGNAAAELGRRA